MNQWNWKLIVGILIAKYFVGQLIGRLAFYAILIFYWRMWPLGMESDRYSSTPHLLTLVLVGALTNFFWDYLIAMCVPTRKMAHAVILVALTYGLSFLLYWSLIVDSFPLWFTISILLVPSILLLGAQWRIKTHGLETKVNYPRDCPPTATLIASPFND